MNLGVMKGVSHPKSLAANGTGIVEQRSESAQYVPILGPPIVQRLSRGNREGAPSFRFRLMDRPLHTYGPMEMANEWRRREGRGGGGAE